MLKEGGARIILDNLGGSPLHTAAEFGNNKVSGLSLLQAENACLPCPFMCHQEEGCSFHCCGGGFFLACEDFWKMFNNLFPACTFLFFKVEISSHKLIPFFKPGSVHSGSASCDNCDWVFPDELHVSSFPDRAPHSAWTAAYSAHSDFERVKGVCVFRCDLPPALLAE